MSELARIFLLAIAAALVVNLVQGGPDRVKGWLSAKFLGRATEPAVVR